MVLSWDDRKKSATLNRRRVVLKGMTAGFQNSRMVRGRRMGALTF